MNREVVIVNICALLLGAGCTDHPAAPADLAVADLARSADLAAASAIGGPCTADSDCAQGKTPVCWKSNLLNISGDWPVRGGYCSSPCADDSDCGDGTCVNLSTGKWCMSKCTGAADCRTGYACFLGSTTNRCYPSGGLSCDPTAADPSCKRPGGRAGACLRFAVGTGKTGECVDSCTGGPGSCPPQGGRARHCVVIDVTASSTGDTWKGPICYNQFANNATGTECVSGTTDYIDACVDGDECLLQSLFANGDNLCHPLCTAGVDGGVPCTSGTCLDVWHLFGTATPIGLCK